ncbi:MAG: hypothetical protein QM657_17720 [Lacrimispora sp.]|uniref:hypothetical protein n=1 Tax=Lacrimispora sp. TaxID=2719234 RepID=UPI0039E3DE97
MDIKITKKLLEDYKRIKREIPILEAELQEMLTTDSGIVSDTVLDYRRGYPKVRSVAGFNWILYECRQKDLECKQEKVKAVEQWIDSIEDVQARCVFRMRYIDGMNWVKIAIKIGYGGNDDYPRRHIRDRYLRKSEIN